MGGPAAIGLRRLRVPQGVWGSSWNQWSIIQSVTGQQSRWPLKRVPCVGGPLGDPKNRKTKRGWLKVCEPYPRTVPFPKSGGTYVLRDTHEGQVYEWRRDSGLGDGVQ